MKRAPIPTMDQNNPPVRKLSADAHHAGQTIVASIIGTMTSISPSRSSNHLFMLFLGVGDL